MQTTSIALPELLRQVAERNLTIPQFQREFVWRESQTKLLIDSISRAYPIGSLLFLNKKPDLPLASRSVQAEIAAESDDANALPEKDLPAVEFYILDGQQRTTSIARVLRNAHPKKLFYFDLKTTFERHEQEDHSWIVSRMRGKSNPDRKDNNRLLRADLIFNQEKTDIYVSEYIEDSGDFPYLNKTEKREAAAKIKGIFETIRNYKVPVVQLDRDSGVESICRVFETINSTGTRLGTFDLAVARFYPKPDLRQLWTDSRDRWPILSEFNIEGDRVLQAMHLMLTARESRYPDLSRSNLLSLKPDFVEFEWNGTSSAVANALKWATQHGARPQTLPNLNVITAMAGVQRTSSWTGQWPDANFIQRWYFAKTLQAGASQASNYRIGQDFSALHRYVKDGTAPDLSTVRLDENEVLRIKPADVRYKALLNIFAMRVREDLISCERIDDESEIHDHHIFPRNAAKKHGLPRPALDSICNRVPILAGSNRKLGEGYPQEYITELVRDATENGTMGGVERRMSDYMLPMPPDGGWEKLYALDNFEAFCKRRAKLILDRVRDVVGDSLSSAPLTEDEMAAGEDG